MPTIKGLVNDMGVVGCFEGNQYVNAWDLVLRIPAETIYWNLLVNFERSMFDKRLLEAHKITQ